jgi:hypothetical protein
MVIQRMRETPKIVDLLVKMSEILQEESSE